MEALNEARSSQVVDQVGYIYNITRRLHNVFICRSISSENTFSDNMFDRACIRLKRNVKRSWIYSAIYLDCKVPFSAESP